MQFGGVTAVNDVSFSINAGEITSVIGPNGAGKTTLFNAVSGVYRPSEGQISLDAEALEDRPKFRDLFYVLLLAVLTALLSLVLFHIQAVWDLCINSLYVFEESFDWNLAGELFFDYFAKQHWLATWGIGLGGAVLAASAYWVIRIQGVIAPEYIVQKGIARTFQNIRLFRSMSALEVVLSGAQLRKGSTRSFLRQESLEVLEFVGLKGAERKAAVSLSYGDQRRLEIGRALATKPRVILLDEPAAGMNEVETSRLADLIRAIRSKGITVLLIEHHMSLVMEVSDRVVVMQNGRVLADGTPNTIKNNNEVIAAYLGDDLVDE
jgi:ABC-type branched-subunit amino acid transport system ATPase component